MRKQLKPRPSGFRIMKISVLICIFATFALAAPLDSQFTRELQQLQEGRDKAVSAALEPIHQKYLANLERLLKKATQAGDLDSANKVKAAIQNHRNNFTGNVAVEQFYGKWICRSGPWSDTRELKANGWVSCKLDGLAKWAAAGDELRIDFPNGTWVSFKLPVRDGKLQGVTSEGKTMTAEKIEK